MELQLEIKVQAVTNNLLVSDPKKEGLYLGKQARQVKALFKVVNAKPELPASK